MESLLVTANRKIPSAYHPTPNVSVTSSWAGIMTNLWIRPKVRFVQRMQNRALGLITSASVPLSSQNADVDSVSRMTH